MVFLKLRPGRRCYQISRARMKEGRKEIVGQFGLEWR
jgi:hypothetical protein